MDAFNLYLFICFRFLLQQSGTVALQTGFSDTNVGYNTAATGNAQQPAGMPFKSAADPNFPQRQQQSPLAQTQQPSQPFNQYQSGQYGAQGYTQITSTTNCYPEGSSTANKDLDVTDQELQALLSQKDIATSLAEDLLKHFGSEGLDVKVEGTAANPVDNGTLSSGPFSPSNVDKMKEVKVEKIEDTQPSSTSKLDNCKKESMKYAEPVKCEVSSSTNKVEKSEPVLKLESLCESQSELEFTIDMDAKTVVEMCRGQALKGVKNCSILSDKSPPPAPPEPPTQRLTKEQLTPPTPSVFLENKKDAFSPQLQEFCLKHPIGLLLLF